MIGTGSMFEGKGEVLGMFEEKGEVLVWKCVAFYFYAAARVVDIRGKACMMFLHYRHSR